MNKDSILKSLDWRKKPELKRDCSEIGVSFLRNL